MSDNSRNKTSSIKQDMRNSFFWNAIENISRMGIQFVIGVMLARLLNASDYGILGIISVFIAISQTLIDAGFSNALIQKKICTKEDYSTVYWINLSIALLVFGLLYVLAPFIASFYESELLIPILRAMGLSVLIQSFYTVHKVKLTKELQFKTLAYIAFFSSSLSGIIAIILAYNGAGVWALVSQTIVSIFIQGILIVFFSHWKPRICFSSYSFNQLFSFGSKILVSNILFTVFNNIYNLVIGKVFQPSVLGYYTRADGYAKLVPNNISGILQNIMLPILSKQQDNDKNLIRTYTKFIKLSSLFIFPLSMLFCSLAKPVIIIMLTEKWIASIPLLQILCIASLFDHLISINNSYLMVKGKSNYILSLSASSKFILVLVLIVSFQYGIIAIAWSRFIYCSIMFLTSSYYLNRTIHIGILYILKNTLQIFFTSLIVALYAWCISLFLPINWWALLFECCSAVLLYYVICNFILKDEIKLAKSISQ